MSDIPEDKDVFSAMASQAKKTPEEYSQVLAEAIAKKHICFLLYKSALRLVEPYCVGYGDRNQLLVRVCQIDAATSPTAEWRLLRVDALEGFLEVPVVFEVRESFRPGDSAMATIIKEAVNEYQ